MGEVEPTVRRITDMTEIDPDRSEATLYVCQDCGDGFEDPPDTSDCPECSGPLQNTTLPHD